MAAETHNSDDAARLIDAKISLLRDRIDRQFKQRLYHLVESHEKDREDCVELFLTHTSLTDPELFERLKHQIRSEIQPYVAKITYCQGHSCTVGFTTSTPPNPVMTAPDLGQLSAQAMRQLESVSEHPLPSSDSQEYSPRVSASAPFRKKANPGVGKGRVRSQTHPKVSKRRIITLKSASTSNLKTIRASVATNRIAKTPALAFDFNIADVAGYFILECPAQGCNFTYSEHPFQNGLAFKHFDACGVSFKDEEDIVRRFGRRVRTKLNGQICYVTHEWATTYNQKVLEAVGPVTVDVDGVDLPLASDTTEENLAAPSNQSEDE